MDDDMETGVKMKARSTGVKAEAGDVGVEKLQEHHFQDQVNQNKM